MISQRSKEFSAVPTRTFGENVFLILRPLFFKPSVEVVWRRSEKGTKTGAHRSFSPPRSSFGEDIQHLDGSISTFIG